MSKELIDRVLLDQNELRTKMKKLQEFLNSDKITELSDNQQFLLELQNLTMVMYEGILKYRVRDLKSDVGTD